MTRAELLFCFILGAFLAGAVICWTEPEPRPVVDLF